MNYSVIFKGTYSKTYLTYPIWWPY